jgi:hypothetical protein
MDANMSFKNPNTPTYRLINKATNKCVAGPFDNAKYSMDEANKWYALYNIKCKVIETKTERIIYEVPGK